MIQCFRQTTRTSYDRNCRQLEARIGGFHAISDTDNSMDTNLIKRAKKYCDKRFLDCVINLIPDSGSKALWSLIPDPIPEPQALSSEPWSRSYFWALSPEPIYHVTTLLYPRWVPLRSRQCLAQILFKCSESRPAELFAFKLLLILIAYISEFIFACF